MRKITDHIVNPVNDRISITVMDDPGAGGANHYYVVDVDGIKEPMREVIINNVAIRLRQQLNIPLATGTHDDPMPLDGHWIT